MPRIAAYLFCANELGEKVKCPQKDAFCNLLKAIPLGFSKVKRAVPNGTLSTEPTAVGCGVSHLSGHTKKSALASRVSRSASLRQGCHYYCVHSLNESIFALLHAHIAAAKYYVVYVPSRQNLPEILSIVVDCLL